MRIFGIVTASVLALSMAGCSNHQDQASIRGVSPDEAAQLSSNRAPADAVKDTPFTADTRFAAGRLAEAEGNPAAAIEQYQEALKLVPDHQPSLFRLGVLHAQLKQYPEAVEACTKYVKATNESAPAYSNLGFCEELAGHPREAETAYQKGIVRDPKNLACRVNYGLMLARHGRVNEAARQWQAVLTPAEVHYNLGSVYEMQGRKEQAKLEYNKALELDPKFADARTRVAGLD